MKRLMILTVAILLAGAGTGQRLGAELHGAHPLIQRQGAVGGGDVLPHFLLLCFLAVDDGTDLLALLPDDAFLDGLALGQQIFQFFKKSLHFGIVFSYQFVVHIIFLIEYFFSQ